MDFDQINLITSNFFDNSKLIDIDLIDSGLINKTFIIEHLINGKKSKFILQCLSSVFESYERVNNNHKLITDHIINKIKTNNLKFDNQRWEVPCLIKCNYNNLFVLPFDSGFWRAMEYIDDTISFTILEDYQMAYQTGLGLAKFHGICSDVDLSKLENTANDFHDTKNYIDQFNMIIKDYNFTKLEAKERRRLHKLVFSLSNHILYIESLLEYLKTKSIQTNLIHGDPKLGNFLFDIQSKYVVSLIDLDTISSGYLLTDLADCIRSICNMAGEEPVNINSVFFDIKCCKHFLNGYFSLINQKTNYCFDLLPEFIYLIIFELTIRFLNDFLQSNMYFKIKYQAHNLYRAEVQYRLLSSFVSQINTFADSLHEFGIFSNPKFVSYVQKIV